MTIRQVSSFKTQPGQVTDQSSAGLKLLGSSSQDHQHSYDQYINLEGYINNSNAPFGPPIGTGWQKTRPVGAVILGNFVLFEGWLTNNFDSGNKVPTILRAIPVEIRPSIQFLPKLFRVTTRIDGVVKSQSLRMETDYTIRFVVDPSSNAYTDVQLSRIRYMLK